MYAFVVPNRPGVAGMRVIPADIILSAVTQTTNDREYNCDGQNNAGDNQYKLHDARLPKPAPNATPAVVSPSKTANLAGYGCNQPGIIADLHPLAEPALMHPSEMGCSPREGLLRMRCNDIVRRSHAVSAAPKCAHSVCTPCVRCVYAKNTPKTKASTC